MIVSWIIFPNKLLL